MDFNYPSIDLKKTGLVIKNLRKENNLTVDELANIMGQSQQAIYKWQRGESIPSIDNLYALSKLFRVPLDSMIKVNREEEEIPLPFLCSNTI